MRKNSMRTEIKDIEVYAILSPESKQVFIGKTKFPNHYQAYKDHARLKILPTKKLFSNASQTRIFPPMYLLERLQTTETRAYGHIIAWTKFFQQNGFQVLAQQKNLDYAEDLTEDNQAIFSEIKNCKLNEVISEKNILVSDYKQSSTKKENQNGTPGMICFYVSTEEYEEIRDKAELAGMSMSKYCKQIVMDGAIVRISFSEYLDELRSIKRVLREIQLGIYQSGKYFPADLENIEKMIERINQNYKHVIRYIDRQFKKLNKMRGDQRDEKGKNRML